MKKTFLPFLILSNFPIASLKTIKISSPEPSFGNFGSIFGSALKPVASDTDFAQKVYNYNQKIKQLIEAFPLTEKSEEQPASRIAAFSEKNYELWKEAYALRDLAQNNIKKLEFEKIQQNYIQTVQRLEDAYNKGNLNDTEFKTKLKEANNYLKAAVDNLDFYESVYNDLKYVSAKTDMRTARISTIKKSPNSHNSSLGSSIKETSASNNQSLAPQLTVYQPAVPKDLYPVHRPSKKKSYPESKNPNAENLFNETNKEFPATQINPSQKETEDFLNSL